MRITILIIATIYSFIFSNQLIAQKEVLGIKKVYIFQAEITRFDFHVWIMPHEDWMDEKCGKYALVEIVRYAKKNMINNKQINKVKDSAEKVKNYFDNST